MADKPLLFISHLFPQASIHWEIGKSPHVKAFFIFLLEKAPANIGGCVLILISEFAIMYYDLSPTMIQLYYSTTLKYY